MSQLEFFQNSLLAFIFLSFLLVIIVPVTFAFPNGWDKNKNFILVSAAAWVGCVIAIGSLNFSVI